MDENLLKGMGKRIAARRKALGITQEEIAEKLDVSTQMISNLECGKKAIRLQNLVKLSEILNISIDYLLTGKQMISNDYSETARQLSKLDERDFSMIKILIHYCIDGK